MPVAPAAGYSPDRLGSWMRLSRPASRFRHYRPASINGFGNGFKPGSAVLSEAQRAERKRQLQAEFEAGIARIVRGTFALGSLLKHLTWPVLAAVAAWLIWRFTPQLTSHLSARSLGGLDPNLLPWLAVSAVLLAVVMAEAFPRWWRVLSRW